MAVGSTQPLTEMSTWCISWGKGGRYVKLTTLPPSCAVVMKSGNLKFLEPSGPFRVCKGSALPYYFMGKIRNVLLFCLKSEIKQATESFENMTNFRVFGNEINLTKLLTQSNIKSVSIRIHYHLFQYFLPAITHTGWAKSRFTAIIYYTLCTYFWPTLYKNTRTEPQSQNGKPNFNLGIEFRNLH